MEGLGRRGVMISRLCLSASVSNVDDVKQSHIHNDALNTCKKGRIPSRLGHCLIPLPMNPFSPSHERSTTDLVLDLLAQGHALKLLLALEATSERPRDPLVSVSRELNGAGMEAGRESLALSHVEADVVSVRSWIPRLRRVHWISAVLHPRTDYHGLFLEALERGCSVHGDPGGEILLAILVKGIKPDDRVRTQPAVPPIP